MYKKIVVATDGSKTSLQAARQGMDLARRFKADLKIVYVIDQRVFFFPHEVQELTAENPYFTVLNELRDNAQAVMDSLKKEAKKHMVEFEPLIREGQIIDEIMKVIKEAKADLLILGTHGQTGEARGILGSTAQALVVLVDCSMLLVSNK